MSKYRTSPLPISQMPPGIPYIISNEAAERFSFYGMKAALAIFLANYLGVLGGNNLSEASATAYVSWFNSAVYLTPLLGAIIADAFFGKYSTIVSLSIVYCLGHLCLALMGIGGLVEFWLLSGLGLIALGAGGIKPCVSAHVGDQFGIKNQHLITKIFNVFYFSINFGAVISNLLIPWVLKWHGPHLAFGIPGVLMALATLFFWMGREKFAHIPAKGSSFIKELFSKEGKSAIVKLIPLVLFVGMFWCLFDQTASRLVFQAERMDREIFGLEILPSQIQAANPFLILVLIPVFTFAIYPAAERIIKLTPLRKIGTGLTLMAVAFIVVSLTQEAIDSGETPHISWQLLAYLILTSAEVMVSIVALEFFYTQAPRKMKSLMMAIFLSAVSVGNTFTAIVNQQIQVDGPDRKGSKTESSQDDKPQVARLAGYDGKFNTPDDLLIGEGTIESSVTQLLSQTATNIEEYYNNNNKLPLKWQDLPKDPWGSQLNYQLISAKEAKLTSDGPDKTSKTKWDLGLNIAVKEEQKNLQGTWLYEAKKEKGMIDSAPKENSSLLSIEFTAGGGLTLDGADYYWFFTKLMVGTAILFIPFALIYKPKTYLHEKKETRGPFTVWVLQSKALTIGK
ncbi:MAG: POT family MFS transporter [Verrucomicrobiota bacterium]|nr:POT family MFS transporter [Verrucomicrobiota bacterium]